MKAEDGAAILGINNSYLDISFTNFIQWYSDDSGGILNILKSTLIIHLSTLDHFLGGAISADKAYIEMNEVTIQNGTSIPMTTQCIDWISMLVLNSRFYNNISIYGGAIAAIATNPRKSKFLIESSEFINNQAEIGGSIYISNQIVDIKNWHFESNSANEIGGSLYLTCPDYDYCEYDIY